MNTYELLLQWGPHRGPHGPMGPGPHWGSGGGMAQWGTGGAGVALWPLVVLLLGLLVLTAAVTAVYLLRRGSEPTDSDPAMDLLRERYARGELTDEEFEARSERLSTGDETGPSAT